MGIKRKRKRERIVDGVGVTYIRRRIKKNKKKKGLVREEGNFSFPSLRWQRATHDLVQKGSPSSLPVLPMVKDLLGWPRLKIIIFFIII